MYEQISRNKWKSAGLVAFFVVFIFVLVWFFEYVTGWGKGGLVLAVLVAMGSAAVGYYSSDKIVLGISRARPVSKDEFPYLYNVVEGLAIAAGIPAPKCYVIDDTAPNAFAAGRKPETAVICVTTGLLEKLNRVELEGVIAHEMSHIKNYDVRLQTLVVVMAGVVALLSDWMLRSFMWGGGGRRRGRSRSGSGGAEGLLVLAGLALAVLSPLVATIIQLAVSRKREFLADASGAMLTRYPAGLASALRKISADAEPLEAANKATAHLYIVNPLKNLKGGGGVNRLFSTHPPIEERIAALEKM
ncbi:MAG TPA: M48 family metallopeptidase [Candidatus Aminicenantes bacterium]|nr:M48 family metallopeptidase [Candidatus Aminicenantes bacterium]HRY64020.1 M48 family metallopeptidase [Candidatus Aminicenantes bacterium]HRZ70933.1 M48 family metallopeptidase [Candidatus Aminicenantes bacterium]